MRWLIGLVVVAAGLGWYFGPFELGGEQDGGGAVLLERPEPAMALQRNSPAVPAAGEPAVEASDDGGRQAETPDAGALQTARQRVAAGDRAGAAAVLRQALGQVRAPLARGRLALALAELAENVGERRQLLGVALRSGAVQGPDYDEAGRALATLNHHPRGSLIDLLTCESYEVRSGDSLWKLCNRVFPEEFGANLESGLVQLVNGLASDGLRPGQSLVVPTEQLEIVIDRRGHGLVAWLGDVPVMAFQVGLGKEGRTPSGTFVVEVKQTEPTWYTESRAIPFGEEGNILGTRWMGFENRPGVMGYGIHGTAHPETIGSDESMGCVRMRNEDVEQLFEIVPRGTEVLIP